MEKHSLEKALSLHRERVHGIKQSKITCPECGNSFESYFLLTAHMKSVHSQETYTHPGSASATASTGRGGILSRAFSTYGKRFFNFAIIVLIGEILQLLIITGLSRLITGGVNLSIEKWSLALLEPERFSGPVLFIVFLLIFAAILVSLLVQGAMIYAVIESQTDRSPGIWNAYVFSLNRIWKMFTATLLVTLTLGIIYGMIWGILFWVSSGLGVTGAGFTIISILLNLPAVFLALRLSFYLQATLLEDCGVVDATSSSWELVSDNIRRVFGIMLVIALIMFPFILILVYVLDTLGSSGSALGYTILTLLSPLAIITHTILYLALRIKLDGPERFSVDSLAEELGIQQAGVSDSSTEQRVIPARRVPWRWSVKLSAVGTFLIIFIIVAIAIFLPSVFPHEKSNEFVLIQYPFLHTPQSVYGAGVGDVGEIRDYSKKDENVITLSGSLKTTYESHWAMRDLWLEVRSYNGSGEIIDNKKVLLSNEYPRNYNEIITLSLSQQEYIASVKGVLHWHWTYVVH